MADITEFNIGQGETFKILISLENTSVGEYLNIDEYTFDGQVRENYNTDELAATFNITKIAPASSGSFYLELTPDDTYNMAQRKYVYDVKMTSGSISRRILEGYITMRPAATR
jgi:hypothetical protein